MVYTYNENGQSQNLQDDPLFQIFKLVLQSISKIPELNRLNVDELDSDKLNTLIETTNKAAIIPIKSIIESLTLTCKRSNTITRSIIRDLISQNKQEILNQIFVQIMGVIAVRVNCSGQLYTLINELLVQGANPNSKDKLGRVPLNTAAHIGNKKLAKLLLNYPADINAIDRQGNTALHIAVDLGHVEIIQLLLAKNADINVKNKLGVRPIDSADMTGNEEIIALFAPIATV